MCLLNDDGNRVIEGPLRHLLVNLTVPVRRLEVASDVVANLPSHRMLVHLAGHELTAFPDFPEQPRWQAIAEWPTGLLHQGLL